MNRVTPETLSAISGMSGQAVEQIQDNVQEAYDAALEARRVADEALEAASGAVTGGAGGGGYGPNFYAAADAPDSVKDAALKGKGYVSVGEDDSSIIQYLMNTYGRTELSQGTFRLRKSIDVPARRHLRGSGPSTNITGLGEVKNSDGTIKFPALSGQYFLAQHDHSWFSDFMLSAGDEASGTHHINTNVTDQNGFSTGADACTIMERIVSRYAKGDAFIVQGFNNRDSKISKLHAWNATGRGFNLNSPDGRASDIVSGSAGTHGLELGTSSANWHVSGKFWYSDGDGMRIAGSRHSIDDVEAQDNDLAGIRVIGNLIGLHNWLADSNSYNGTKYTNWHSGLEVGLLPATAAGTPGTASGGYNISVSNGRSWDKSEGGRGFNQRYGVLLRSGIRNFVMTNIQTGGPTDTHRNATGGIYFLTASDLNHSQNFVTACMNHGVRMFSA